MLCTQGTSGTMLCRGVKGSELQSGQWNDILDRDPGNWSMTRVRLRIRSLAPKYDVHVKPDFTARASPGALSSSKARFSHRNVIFRTNSISPLWLSLFCGGACWFSRSRFIPHLSEHCQVHFGDLYMPNRYRKLIAPNVMESSSDERQVGPRTLILDT